MPVDRYELQNRLTKGLACRRMYEVGFRVLGFRSKPFPSRLKDQQAIRLHTNPKCISKHRNPSLSLVRTDVLIQVSCYHDSPAKQLIELITIKTGSVMTVFASAMAANTCLARLKLQSRLTIRLHRLQRATASQLQLQAIIRAMQYRHLKNQSNRYQCRLFPTQMCCPIK